MSEDTRIKQFKQMAEADPENEQLVGLGHFRIEFQGSFERLDGFVDDPRLWAPTLDILGTGSVSLFTDKLNFKRPLGAPFPWHQDAPYWAFGCDHVDRRTKKPSLR